MTGQYWENVLKRITYKKDVTFSIRDDWGNARFCMLVVSRVAEDVENPDVKIPLFYRESFPMDIPDDAFIYLCYSAVRMFEMHELDEWFKVDGKHHKDPHPEVGF